MEEVKKKRGRPAKDDARRNQAKTLLSDDEMIRLKKISKKSGLSQMNIMRIGMTMFIGQLEELYPDTDINEEDLFEYGIMDDFTDGFGEGLDDEESIY